MPLFWFSFTEILIIAFLVLVWKFGFWLFSLLGSLTERLN